MDWLDLLAVQGTLKNLLQHHSSKASILLHSAFFTVQLSHPYMTTEKTIAPRSKCLLILWLQSLSAEIFGSLKNQARHSVNCFPIYLPWSDGTRIHDLSFLNVSFKPAFSLSSFTFIKRLFISSSLSAIKVVSSTYLRLLVFLSAVCIPGCDSSSLAFWLKYSEYKLNKQVDNIQVWQTPFQFWTSLLFHVWF